MPYAKRNFELLEERNSIAQSPYIELQKNVDAVVGKIGVSNAITLLKSIIGEELEVAKPSSPSIIQAFLITKSCELSELQENSFYNDNSKEFREVRMICYYLFKKYTSMSYGRVASQFNTSKRKVVYYHQKIEEMLSIESFYKVFFDKHYALEKQLIQFLGKVNN